MKLSYAICSLLLVTVIVLTETRHFFSISNTDEQSMSQTDEMEKNEMEETEKEGKEKREDGNENNEKLCPSLTDSPGVALFPASRRNFIYSAFCRYSALFEVVSPPPQIPA